MVTRKIFIRHKIIFFLLIFCLVHAEKVWAGQIEEFLGAKNAFDTGDYQESIRRFRDLLGGDPPRLSSRHLRIEAHQYLGAALIITGDNAGGEEQFEELLAIDPQFQIEPALFPTSVLDVFSRVHERVLEREAKIRENQEKRRINELKKSIKSQEKNIIIGKTVERHNLLYSFIPFGVGQFQNGDKVKGYLIFSGEIAFLAVNIISWSVNNYFPASKYCPDDYAESQCDQIEDSSKILSYINWTSLAAFLGLVVYGIIDALVYYEPQIELEQREIGLPARRDLFGLSLGLTSFGFDLSF